MAEHVRHELARADVAFRPSRVRTLAQLLDGWELEAPAPAAVLQILIADALTRLRPERFTRVLESSGLHAELAKLMEETPRPEECGDRLGELFLDIESRLAERGLASRNRRLREAARKLRLGEAPAPEQVVFDGFFTFASAEIEFIQALAERSSVVVTLPEEDARLARAGFEVERFEGARSSAARAAFAASSPEQEAEEIARRILEHASSGRQFREMGVILRSREPYRALIETTLARFGIPAHYYFSDSVASHPAIVYLAGIVRAVLSGWDHARLNALLRMPVSGLGATSQGDKFDFALRELLPGRGLPIAGIANLPEALTAFQNTTRWTGEKLTPTDWASRLKGLTRLAPITNSGVGDRDQTDALRSTAAAIAGFEETVGIVAGLRGSAKLPLAQFWKHIETGLAATPLRVQDRRRNVVHVMDVYEARQWELPVVFVCGLLERVFPIYHGENPVMGDAARRRIGLPTSAQKQSEEQFLFEIATTRATEQLILSYSRFDEKGEETLPSSFLAGTATAISELRVRPKAMRSVIAPTYHPLTTAPAGQMKLSASGIEKFLQCPFQFFAYKTLRLKERPKAPRDRLDVLMQGTILHRALAEVAGAPLLGSAVLDQIFDQECARERVPRTYRTEAVRLELLRHFESFLRDRQADLGWKWEVEKQFEFALNENLTLRGRIDRLEIGPEHEALVVDYKYSTQVRGRRKENESGGSVQGGLYLLAAERALGLNPVGMLFVGVKGRLEWEGWHIQIPGLERTGEVCARERLRELMDLAEQSAVSAQEGILAGRIEVRPADRKKCDWCDYRDICRVEAIAEERVRGAGG